MSDEITNEVDVTIDPTFVRAQDTLDYAPDRSTQHNWEAVRDECVSGGAMDERCNIIKASLSGGGNLDVVAKKLSCGCILIRTDHEELF